MSLFFSIWILSVWLCCCCWWWWWSVVLLLLCFTRSISVLICTFFSILVVFVFVLFPCFVCYRSIRIKSDFGDWCMMMRTIRALWHTKTQERRKKTKLKFVTIVRSKITPHLILVFSKLHYVPWKFADFHLFARFFVDFRPKCLLFVAIFLKIIFCFFLLYYLLSSIWNRTSLKENTY